MLYYSKIIRESNYFLLYLTGEHLLTELVIWSQTVAAESAEESCPVCYVTSFSSCDVFMIHQSPYSMGLSL